MADAAVLIIGVGNELRGDDAVGIVVVRALRAAARDHGIDVREEQGESTGLIAAWDGRDGVVLVDAMRSGARPGEVRRLDLARDAFPDIRGSSSTHAVALDETIELARTLGRLPERVVLYAVEGERFDTGAELSAAVAAAVPEVADAVLRDATGLRIGVVPG